MENSSRSFLNLYKFSKKHIKNNSLCFLFLIDEKEKTLGQNSQTVFSTAVLKF